MGSVVLILAVSVPNLSFISTGYTSICEVKDNKKAAVVFTSDDGFYNSVSLYVSLWKRYNLKGTVALTTCGPDGNTKLIHNSYPKEYYGTWAEWNTLVASGYLDIGNHSQTHRILPTCTASELEFEINGAKQRIDSNIQNFKTICCLCTSGKYNNTVINKVMEQHYACRVADHGYNSFSPTLYEIFRLKRQQIVANTTVSEANSWIDNAIKNKTWIIEAFHGTNGEGYEPPPSSFFEGHWYYVHSKADDVWCASFSEITKYIREKMAATIQLMTSNSSKITLNLTDTLPDNIFNYPLTLKTEVPAAWSASEVSQNNMVNIIIPKNEGGAYFVYYDAIPDRGQITLKPYKTVE